MSGSAITAYLRRLCRDMDAGRPLEPFPWRRSIVPLAVPVVMGLSLGAAGCEESVSGGAAPEYAAPMPHQAQPMPLQPDPEPPEPAPVPAYMAPPPALGDGGPTKAPGDAEAPSPSGGGGDPAPAAQEGPSKRPPSGRAISPGLNDLYGVPFD